MVVTKAAPAVHGSSIETRQGLQARPELCDIHTVSEEAWASVGERVRQARLAASLTQSALARELDVDRSALARIESGDRHLSAMELYALATALRLPLSHFVVAAPAAIASHRQDLNDDADQVSRTSFRMDALLQAHARDADWLHRRGYLPPPNGDLTAAFETRWADDGGESARQAAHDVRSALGLIGPIARMADAVARAGLYALVVEDLPGGASLLLDGGIGVAVVGGADDVVRRRMTTAHELGHFVLRDEYRTDIGVSASRDEREQRIEAFATEFLLPSAAIESTWHDLGTTTSSRHRLIHLSCDYGASWSATVSSARRLQLVSPHEATLFKAGIPTLGELIEVVGSPPIADLAVGDTAIPWQKAVLAAYRDGAITAARTVELVHGALTADGLPDLPSADRP